MIRRRKRFNNFQILLVTIISRYNFIWALYVGCFVVLLVFVRIIKWGNEIEKNYIFGAFPFSCFFICGT